jgi:dihydroorotate dehydrogenase (NAD+) catalytic subunit
VGVGGISSGADAVAMLMAGAQAVEIGTATFKDPRAPWRIARELDRWLLAHGETVLGISGRAHG